MEAITDQWAGWRDAATFSQRLRLLGQLLLRSVKDAITDNMTHWAASMAYYSALSFAPLMFVSISIASFFVDASWAADRVTTILESFLPKDSGQVKQFIDSAVSARGRIGIFSFAAFMFTGTRIFAALTRALNVIYDVEHEQDFVRETAVQILMLFTVGLAFLLALSSRFLFGLLWNAVQILPSGQQGLAQRIVAGIVQVILLFIAYVLIYRLIPKERNDWQSALVGATVATSLFVVVRPLFLFYLNRNTNQELIYGSLTSLIVILLWIWIASLIILFGGEVAVNFQEMIVDGESEDQDEQEVFGDISLPSL